VALKVERVLDGSMHAQETLGGSAASCARVVAPPVRVLGPIVFAKSLLVVAGEPGLVEGSAVGAQLIGDHHLWGEGLLSQQLAHDLDGRAILILIDAPLSP
jgi:hypothetical protein